MPVDPILVPFLPGMLPLPEEIDDFHAFRTKEDQAANAFVDQICEPAPPGAVRREVQIPVDGGTVALHIFTPAGPGPHPVHFYIHGGGWVGGSIHHTYIDILCSERAVGAEQPRGGPQDQCASLIGGQPRPYRLLPDHSLGYVTDK